MDIIRKYKKDLIKAVQSLPTNKVIQITELIAKAKQNKNNIFLFGNGGSSSTPSHSAGDWSKELKLRSYCLSDNIPALTAYSNDLSYDDIYIEQLKVFLNKDDIVIAYSGSGNSKNVLKAIEYANSAGAISIGITGNYLNKNGGFLAQTARYSIIVNSESMEIIEDCHLVINHIIKNLLMKI